ncbi:MAG: DUF1343 domain-containing protein [Peptostreptococcaceae bacterium]|nr:DUF1343 domain-containing protein [Peptostreptococcaceae bacterium]
MDKRKDIFTVRLILITLLLSLSLVSKIFADGVSDDYFRILDQYLFFTPSATESESIFSKANHELVSQKTVLGNERLLTEFSYLIDGKKIGLITNHTGVNSKMERTADILFRYPSAQLTSIYSPEHGLDGKATAGAYVESYTEPAMKLPVYSLYGKTRKPSSSMLKDVDILLFDMQDIGSRTYTYMSTLNYCMVAAKENGKKLIVLDRPNPVGGVHVEGYVLEDKYKTFVGVDNLPMAHGMTAGELASYFNRKIGCDLTVISMKNYTRSMVWQDTGLPFVQTSPNIPNIESAFCYMATGIGDGTGLGQGDKFTWVGGKGFNSERLASALNAYQLPGISFIPQSKGERGGVKLKITDYRKFNPARTGFYILAAANLQKPLNVPVEKKGVIPMFEKNMGGNRFGKDLLAKKTPQQIEESYRNELEQFKQLREKYLIYP